MINNKVTDEIYLQKELNSVECPSDELPNDKFQTGKYLTDNLPLEKAIINTVWIIIKSLMKSAYKNNSTVKTFQVTNYKMTIHKLVTALLITYILKGNSGNYLINNKVTDEIWLPKN